MSTLLKLGLRGYDVKPRFGANSPTKSNFFKEIILVALDTYAVKINPPSIILGGGGGGVHGKACWLMAYMCICMDVRACNINLMLWL